jgi:PmbA protein
MNELKEMAGHVLEVARAEGADDVVTEAIDSSIAQVRFSNSQIDCINSWNEKHVALFVAVGNRVMSTDLRDLDSKDRLARELVALAKKAPPSKTYGGIAKGRFKYRSVKVDKRIIGLSDPAKYVLDAIRGAESAGANNIGGTFYVRHERNAIASSGGAFGSDEIASVDLSVRAFAQPEASGHAVCCTSRLSDLDARRIGERAGEMGVKAKDPVQGEEGKMDIIMEPLFLGSMTQSTSRMMSAMSVEVGLSMYAKRIGKRVASGDITFMDDPTITSTSRRSFDHEGVPARRNVLIKNGVLKTFLHNTSTAKRFKTKTTASAGPLIPTGFAMAAQPLPFHPVLMPGDWKLDEIIADTKRGLYLNNTWYTRFQNYSTGEFSTIPRDAILRIENGEIVGAVKNIRVSDNLMNLWKSVDALSRSTEEVYWWEEASPPSTLPIARATSMNITRSS